MKVEQYSRTYGVPRDVAPLEGLLEEIRRTAGAIDWLGAQIAELDPSAVAYGLSETIEREGGSDAVREVVQRAGINVLVQLYLSERRHYADSIRIALASDADTRLLNLEALRAGAYLVALERVLDRLSLNSEQREIARHAVPEVLQLVAESHGAEVPVERASDPPMPLE